MLQQNNSSKKQTPFGKHQYIEHEDKTILFLQELLEEIPRNFSRLESRKNRFAEHHKIPTLKNREIIVVAQKHNISLPEKLQNLLQKRAVRTVSGVSPIGILTKPFECPGKCVYCPTEDRMPKSYMKNQPAAARALRNNFDPFDQVKNRVIALQESGHPTSKLEIIVMGGTWSFLPRGYQKWYIENIFRSANSFQETFVDTSTQTTPKQSIQQEISNQNKPLFFLDFDGVIADSYDFVFEKTAQAGKEFGKTLTKKEFQSIFRSPHSWDGFLEWGKNPEILARYSQIEAEEYAEEVPLFIEILPHLQTLSQYFDLVIVSANQKKVIRQMLQKWHIESLFKTVIGREDKGSKAEKIQSLLAEKKQNPSQTLFIGDTLSDIAEGKKAGVISVGAGWGKIFSVQELQDSEADFVLQHPNDLCDAFGIEERHIEAGKTEGEIISNEGKKTKNTPFQIPHFSTPDTLIQEQKINETASHRIIGLTLETRPDFITENELVRMRNYGCTRIEIGVQTLDDDVQKLTKRGHTKAQVSRAMKLMKDFGFKVCFHLMPGLPGSTPEKDLQWMKEVFENPDFRPDFIKIYPCMVLPTAELAQLWKNGAFEPISDKELIKLLIQFQAFVPEWTRIMRLMRDIPASNILDGAKFSNLRQILQEQPKKLLEIVGEEFYTTHDLANRSKNLFRDIRSREVGFTEQREQHSPPKLTRRDYHASDGTEVFLSFESEDQKDLYALLRLRKPSTTPMNIPLSFQSVLENSALIREVHSYGSEISVGDEAKNTTGQHKGFGRKLIAEAERIAFHEWGLKKISVIAGVGTREYYRKWGYSEESTYMVKTL